MTAPRELDDSEAVNLMIGTLGALLAVAPGRTFTVDRTDLHPGTRILVEVLEGGSIRFSLDGGARQ